MTPQEHEAVMQAEDLAGPPENGGTSGSMSLTVAEAARIMREAVKNKSYQLLPMGQGAATYLHAKRKRLTDSSYRNYERVLDKFARHFPDLQLEDFKPPIGTDRVEGFLDHEYGDSSPRNYNKNLSIRKDFFGLR